MIDWTLVWRPDFSCLPGMNSCTETELFESCSSIGDIRERMGAHCVSHGKVTKSRADERFAEPMIASDCLFVPYCPHAKTCKGTASIFSATASLNKKFTLNLNYGQVDLLPD